MGNKDVKIIITPEDAQLIIDICCDSFVFALTKSWGKDITTQKPVNVLVEEYNALMQEGVDFQKIIFRRILDK